MVILFTYFGTWNLYFLQDEWAAFGKAIFANQFGWMSLVRVFGFHFVPLTSFTVATLYTSFGLQYQYYAWFAIVFHTLNAFLLSSLVHKITNNKGMSFLSGIIFAILNAPEQAVTAASVSPSVLPATAFAILSLLWFYDFIRHRKASSLMYSNVSLFTGLLFKEDIVFLFVLLIIVTFAIQKRELSKVIISYTLIIATYSALRLWFFLSSPYSQYAGRTMSVTDLLPIIFNALLLLPKAFAYLIISPSWILSISRWYIDKHGVYLFSVVQPEWFGMIAATFTQIIIMPIVAYITTLTLVIVGAFGIRKLTVRTEHRHLILVALLYVVLSFLPFAFLPKHLTIESRHFYMPAIGASILLSVFFTYLIQSRNNMAKFTGAIMLLMLVLGNSYQTQKGIQGALSERSNIMKSIVYQVRKLNYDLPTRAVIVAQGDPLPIQFGAGYLFLILYHTKQPYYEFLMRNVLWDHEGYQEYEGTGFGYFRDFDDFLAAYKESNLTPESVFAFFFDSKSGTIQDTTQVVRENLITD